MVDVFLLVSRSTLPSSEQGLYSGSGEVCGRAQAEVAYWTLPFLVWISKSSRKFSLGGGDGDSEESRGKGRNSHRGKGQQSWGVGGGHDIWAMKQQDLRQKRAHGSSPFETRGPTWPRPTRPASIGSWGLEDYVVPGVTYTSNLSHKAPSTPLGRLS